MSKCARSHKRLASPNRPAPSPADAGTLGRPITPAEARASKVSVIPREVFAAVNKLLVERLSGDRASILQRDIVAEIEKLNPEFTEGKLVDNHWLDFEDAYRDAGWNVVYDKPGYNESYPASFEFRRQR